MMSDQMAAPICIVDDNAASLAQMRIILERASLGRVLTFDDPRTALERFRGTPPGVLVLDWLMPHMDGLALLHAMKAAGIGESVPVAVVTGGANVDAMKLAAYREGVIEVLPKPLDAQEFALRVRNLARVAARARTEGRFDDGFRPLELPRFYGDPGRTALSGAPLFVAHASAGGSDLALLRMLERVAAIRDENTGKHTVRMAHYAAAIGHAYGLGLAQQDQLLQAAPLHDIGKIAIPDAVLLKNGRLDAAEMDIMKRHTTHGYELLRDEPSPVLQLGAEIALSHHERWDGNGYPLGLRGADIPLSGRIVAVADAFDAMTTVRPYKPAWLAERAIAVIVADSGLHFDPDVVKAFLACVDRMLAIKRHFDGDDAFIPSAALPQ